MKTWILLLLTLSLFPARSFAWGRKGHEVVAYIAYQNLDDPTRKEVDYLVTLNPCYTQWKHEVATLPPANQSVALFMLAATWPDLIKQATYSCDPGHTFIVDGGDGPNGRFSIDVPPDGPEASQNLGYTDNRRHQYWHFVDTPFSPDNTPTRPAYTVNALTQIEMLTAALQSDETPAMKSYDLAWLEHLVGDVHQPLHVTSRFTAGNPNGDAGGNLVAIVQSPNELHGYWDNLPGADNLAAAIAMGKTLNVQKAPSQATLDMDEPGDWVQDSFKLAQKVAYARPVSSGAAGAPASNLNATYKANAVKTVNQQLFLAGWRLASLLKEELG